MTSVGSGFLSRHLLLGDLGPKAEDLDFESSCARKKQEKNIVA